VYIHYTQDLLAETSHVTSN